MGGIAKIVYAICNSIAIRGIPMEVVIAKARAVGNHVVEFVHRRKSVIPLPDIGAVVNDVA